MTISAGDAVVWESQSSGVTTEKRGRVLCEVAAMAWVEPSACRNPQFKRGRRRYSSWLVEVDGCTYWPRPQYLRRVDS